LYQLRPSKAYLSIPTRPPALKWVRPPGEEIINSAYQTFAERVQNVEYLIGYEGNAFACTGNPKEDLLSITAVYPMREDALSHFLERAGVDWSLIENLMARDLLVDSVYEGNKFFMRRLHS
jgi:wyosine [tRNA(Phe)-imidazoG37] synthetase (radical SAM superfamily)